MNKNFYMGLTVCFLFVSCHETDENMKESSLKLVRKIEQFQQERLSQSIEKGISGDAESSWMTAVNFISAYEHCLWMENPDDSLMEEMKRLGIKWMKKSAESGCPYAMIDIINIDDYYMGSSLSVSKKIKYTEDAYRLLISKEKKNGMDAFYLHKCYSKGVGTKKNYWLALRWAIRYVVRFTEEERIRRINDMEQLICARVDCAQLVLLSLQWGAVQWVSQFLTMASTHILGWQLHGRSERRRYSHHARNHHDLHA